MEKNIKVIYHYHSGFSIEINSILLIFDYYENDENIPNIAKINEKILSAYNEIYVFVSHNSIKHFDPIIYTWKQKYPELPITYIIPHDMPIGTKGKRIQPQQNRIFSENVHVQAFKSTTEGVAYLVKVFETTVFHAGDLNLWHWREINSLQEIEFAQELFHKCVQPILSQKIDICMFPTDPRQGPMYDAGGSFFILANQPRVFIPMHFQNRAEIVEIFKRRYNNNNTEILALTMPGICAKLNFNNNFLNVHIIEPPKEKIKPIEKTILYEKNNPFINSDLPIDL